MKVICDDDTNRPSDFPLSKWVKKGKEYTIIEVKKLLPQGVMGCKLAEIDTDGLTYEYFRLSRFRPKQDDLADEIQELIDQSLEVEA